MSKCFDHLKHAIITAPVLQAPDTFHPYVAQCDASQTGVGCVLLQADAKEELHPVVFLSKKLLPREKHLATIEKECLAIWSLTRLRSYLWGQKIDLQTDHSPLC